MDLAGLKLCVTLKKLVYMPHSHRLGTKLHILQITFFQWGMLRNAMTLSVMKRTLVNGLLSANLFYAKLLGGTEKQSNIHMRQILEKSGKKMSFGLNFPGVLILTVL